MPSLRLQQKKVTRKTLIIEYSFRELKILHSRERKKYIFALLFLRKMSKYFAIYSKNSSEGDKNVRFFSSLCKNKLFPKGWRGD